MSYMAMARLSQLCVEVHCLDRIWFSPWLDSPQWARASSLSRIHDHTQTHHNRQDSSGQGISPRQSPLPDNTQHSQETHMHDPGWIRTRNSSKRKAADPLFIPSIFSEVLYYNHRMSHQGIFWAEYRMVIEGHTARAPSGVGKKTWYRFVTLVLYTRIQYARCLRMLVSGLSSRKIGFSTRTVSV